MSAKTYELKDQTTGFADPKTVDPKTGEPLKIVRDQQVTLDTSKGVGEATLQAIRAGRLIEVNRTSKSAAEEAGEEKAASKKSTGRGK